MSKFPANARLFCVVDAVLSPAGSTTPAPGDGPGSGSEPRGNEPTGAEQPAPAEEGDRAAPPREKNL
jgi:hypothetical protein